MSLFTMKDLYPSGAPGVRDTGGETVTNAVSGGVSKEMDSIGTTSPVKSILIMAGLLLVVRLIWENT
jgi:hypothetical protein